MPVAERRGAQVRDEAQVSRTDVVVIGITLCVALIPGVSRSGAAISEGLLRFVARHPITTFLWYRIALAAVIAVLLSTGAIAAS